MRTNVIRQRDPALHEALRLALVFAAIKLAVHVAANLWQAHLGWGYFRDEFYYIACGRHLAWGYVDHGPVGGASSPRRRTPLRTLARWPPPLRPPQPEPPASS